MLSCESQIDVWELLSDSSYLSAFFDRQGLFVAPMDLRAKIAESFSPQLLQGFWSKLKKENPKIVVMSPTVPTNSFKQKWYGNSTIRVCPWQSIKSLAENIPCFGPESGKIWWLKKVQYFQKKYHCQWTFLRGKKPKWIFHNLGNLLRPLEFVPASRERVVPTEWQIRRVFWRLYIKSKSDSSSSTSVSAIRADQ